MFKIALLALLFTFVCSLNVQQRAQESLNKGQQEKVFIIFKQHVDFAALQKTLGVDLQTMDEIVRGRLVVDSLKSVSEESQKRVISYLQRNNVKFESHWISNVISVEANLALVKGLATFNEIESIDKVDTATIIEPLEQQNVESPRDKNQVVEAGVQWVKAPEVWRKGYKGQGITVGVIDTGATLHNDLKNFYRGRDGNHATAWLDATSNRRPQPYDDNFHGTHCHGTVSANGTTETVGVAVEAQWVSCKFLTGGGSGTYDDALKCFTFMLAPNGNSDIRPHVVSNSYGGGVPTAALERALDALLAAGVEMVFAAGNSGTRCGSVLMPALYPQAFSVGALNRNSHQLAAFSSRGPGREANKVKPEISAPGALVRSTSNTSPDGYRSASGTSMACPHVAGVIALLWSANAGLRRNILATRRVLEATAGDRLSQETLECSSPTRYPNNLYGYGTVNVLKAVELAEKLDQQKSLNL